MSELKHEERRGVLCTVLEVEIMPHQRYRLCAVQLSPIMVLLISYSPNDLTCLGWFFFYTLVLTESWSRTRLRRA